MHFYGTETYFYAGNNRMILSAGLNLLGLSLLDTIGVDVFARDIFRVIGADLVPAI